MTAAEQELEDALVEMVDMNCASIDLHSPLNSYANLTSATAMRLLARRGQLTIIIDSGRLVTGRWVTR